MHVTGEAVYIVIMNIWLPLILSCLASYSSARGVGIIGRTAGERHTPQRASYIVHQFANPTWVENIAVRQNGDLLVTLISKPELYLIDPHLAAIKPHSDRISTLLHNFSPYTALLGITEVQPDRFFIIACNATLDPFDFAPGSYTVQSLDLSSYDSHKNRRAVAKEVAKISTASILDGMTTLDATKGLVIMADSIQGAIYILNVNTGEYSILLQESEMAVPPGFPAGELGINGVRVLPGKGMDIVYIYFDNTASSIFCRVPLSISTLTKTGPVEILTTSYSGMDGMDDFALDPVEGVAYMADGNTNSIIRIPLAGGEVTTVLGGVNQTIVAGATSVALGRGRTDEFVKYITTSGGFINGTFTEGGRVVALVT
jgi:hypothetical protein